MLRVSLVTTGSELTTGRVVDTNAAWLAARISALGGEIASIRVVADDARAIRSAIRQAVAECRHVIVSGGLGPTRDDLTRDCLARLARAPLVVDRLALRSLRRFYLTRGRYFPPGAETQACVPRGALSLANPVGTAAGFRCRIGRSSVWALPGVPAEMKAMFAASVAPSLRHEAAGRGVILNEVIRTVGLPESRVEGELSRSPAVDVPGVTIGFLIERGTILATLRSSARTRAGARAALTRAVREVRRRLGRAVFAVGERTLEEVIVRRLARRRETLSIAESCTGGQLAARLVRVPGCSRVLREAIVCYSNDSKRRRLGVPPHVLRRFGAVSRECASAMAVGVRRTARATYGVAITGIAGPGGGGRGKPVGLVHLAVSGPRGLAVGEQRFAGDRATVQARAVVAALDMVRRYAE